MGQALQTPPPPGVQWRLEEGLGLGGVDARGANWREESCLSTQQLSSSVNPGAPCFHPSKLLSLGHCEAADTHKAFDWIPTPTWSPFLVIQTTWGSH